MKSLWMLLQKSMRCVVVVGASLGPLYWQSKAAVCRTRACGLRFPQELQRLLNAEMKDMWGVTGWFSA